MKTLGANISEVLGEMGANSSQARVNMRAHQVRSRYRQALETVYGANTELFLAHTNNVYIMNKEGVKTLIVYVDESIWAAELNAQRELIKLKLLELFGEDVEEFEIYISRGNYKDHHPYLQQESYDELQEQDTAPSPELDAHEEDFVNETVSKIDDLELRSRIKKAMTSDLRWKKGEKVNFFTENRK